MEDLKYCPFCKSKDVDDESYLFVKCNNCGATGPKMNCADANADHIDRIGARTAWNERV